jgi:hypothetical protein
MKPVDKKSNKLKAKVVNSPARTKKPDGDKPFGCERRSDI